MKLNKVSGSATALILAIGITGSAFVATSAQGAVKASAATSAADFGGLKGLVAACKVEKALNIIADPHDWANYGEIITGFKKAYGVKINEANPNGSSQDEINAANQLKGTTRAPDVFDLGQAVLYANFEVLAPYKVINWNGIPASFKAANGLYTKDYGGIMSVGYDASLGTVTKLDDLLGAQFAGKVALNGDPTKANAGQNGVLMASLANGGSLNDISQGVDWFKKLAAAGNFINVDPNPATIASGQTPVVFDWDYNQAAVQAKFAAAGKKWNVFFPAGALVGAYYNQAIDLYAPHPACARLWMEYLFSPAGSNAWLKGGSRPVLLDWMIKHKTVNQKALASLPSVKGNVVIATPNQSKAAADYLTANWTAAVGTR
ncbi:MAG TPA: ABC transporter substrate-binding protein [Candidatus Nanopelagicaceae bacterium]